LRVSELFILTLHFISRKGHKRGSGEKISGKAIEVTRKSGEIFQLAGETVERGKGWGGGGKANAV